ncbi:MAG: FUSC family protein [Coriobacteriia bacterium]|nr:FUSC family protein [Coriobacteriia bacterium]
MDTNRPLPYWVSIPCVIIFFAGFRLIFGSGNAVVGYVFFSALVLLSRTDQLEIRPLKDGLIIFAVSMAIGTATIVSGLDPRLGFFVNLVSIFCIIYFLFGTFQTILFLPATMGYLFLLGAPEPFSHVRERIAALLLGTVILMVALLSIQLSEKSYTVKAKLQNLLELIANKAYEATGITPAGYTYVSTEEIRRALHELFGKLYRMQQKNKRTRDVDEVRISFALALERFTDIIQKIKHAGPPNEEEIVALTELAELLLETKTHVGDFESFALLTEDIDAYVARHKNDTDLSPELYEILETCTLTSHQLKLIAKAGLKTRNTDIAVKDESWMGDIAQTLNPNRLRLNYALKMSITISVVWLVAKGLLHPVRGQWAAFMVAFLMRPYAEDTHQRTMDRIKGTALAIGLFLALFGLVKSVPLQIVLIMLSSILYSRRPKAGVYQVTFTTFMAVASMALISGKYSSLGIERVAYMGVGIIIAFIVGQNIAPSYVISDTAKLIEKYRKTTYELVQLFIYSRLHEKKPTALKELSFAKTSEHHTTSSVFQGLILTANLIEQQVFFNNRRIQSEDFNEFFATQRRLTNDIFFLYATLSAIAAHTEGFEHLLRQLRTIMHQFQEKPLDEFYHNEGLTQAIEEFTIAVDAGFAFCRNEKEKMAFTTLGGVADGLKKQLRFDFSETALRG